MPDRDRKRIPDARSNVLKRYLPHYPPAHPWNTRNLNTQVTRLKEEYGGTHGHGCVITTSEHTFLTDGMRIV